MWNLGLEKRKNHPYFRMSRTIQNGKQDYKKTKVALKLNRLKAEAKRSAPGIRETILVILAVLLFLLCIYAFFYLNLSTEINLDAD
uniref:Triple QxxK/R motif-containing protein n=1 Tax=Denticeps clupeoides TaxID=299321 RepID=A0AAY4CK60_9TELE